MFETTCLDELRSESFTPILPPEQKSRRTIVLFGVDDFIRSHSEEEIMTEIYRVNDFTANFIDSIFKFPNNPMMKISFTQTAPAQKCKEQGLKLFSMRIPHHQIKEEEYTPVTSCMRCYEVGSHFTNQCEKPKDYTICSECGSQEHKWYDCTSSAKKCMNCKGPHRTLAYKCPLRKEAREKAKETKKSAGTKTYSSAVSTHPCTTHPCAANQDLFNPDAANRILVCLLQAHLMNVADSGSFQDVLNHWLEANNLPAMIAPDNPASNKLLRPSALLPRNLQTTTTDGTPEDAEDADEPTDEDDPGTEEDEEIPAAAAGSKNARKLPPPDPPTHPILSPKLPLT